MNRRAFLSECAIFCGSAALAAAERGQDGDAPVRPPSRFKLGAISDGFSQDFGQALQIMKSYGLSWVEIREVFGIYNTEAGPEQVRQLKNSLDQYGFRVSVIDSALYKCTLPGTEPIKRQKDAYVYSKQMDLLKRACDRAHALGTDKVRGFSFWRVAEPQQLAARIAGELDQAAEVASRAGIRLVIENEESCNAATGHELGALLRIARAPNLGANWDVGNGYWHGEVAFPDGYRALERNRIWHMHIKGVSCGPNLKNCTESVAGQGQLDLYGQLTQLIRDGYQETMSLECEFKAPGLTHLETSKRSLEGLLKIMHRAARATSHPA